METSQLAQVLRDKGYRLTPQRVEVINLVMEKLAKKEHPTFNDILTEVKQKMPSISASTVYSILKLMEENGFVVSFEHEGRTYYDSVTSHINVVCVNTNKVIDMEDEEIVGALRRRGIHPSSIVVKAVCTE
jgi:Fur family peroxide stress response transcriptional regulator